MSIKLSEFVPSPKPIILPSNDGQKPTITASDVKKTKDNGFFAPDILLSNRNSILSNGTYIQARRELQDTLKPIINKLEMIYAVKTEDKPEIPSFRTLIEKNILDSKGFNTRFDDVIENIKKGNFGFSHFHNMNKILDELETTSKNLPASEELTQFKTHFKGLKTDFDKLFNTKDNRIKFVFQILQAIDLNDKFDSAIKKLSQSPVNQNADLALFSEQMVATARNIRDVAGNVTAYSQANHFDEAGLHKRVLEMPDSFKEFAKTLSEVAQNPSVQNSKEYVELLTNLHNHATKVMQFFLPEVKKAIDTHQKNTAVRVLANAVNTDASDKKDTIPQNVNPIFKSIQNKMALYQQQQAEPVPAKQSYDMQAPNNINQMLEFLKNNPNNPQALLSPYSAKNPVHSPTSDDKELRALQGLWDWADHSAHMKNKINAVNEIGQTMEEIAMSGSGRPNPEMVALSKRSGRLNSLKTLMAEVPKINKATQELEKSSLEAEHAYMTGVNQIATQRLKLDIDGAHMQSEQQKVYQKGLEKLGLDGLEISTNMARNFAKVTGLFNEILMARIDNVWDNIKRLTRGFKF